MHYLTSKIALICLIPILTFFAGIQPGTAQNLPKKTKTFALGIHTYYGFILKHTESIGHLAQSHPYAIEINLNRITDGSKTWHHSYRFPEVGYAIGLYDFRNPILGKAMYAFTYVDKALLKGNSSALRLKIGTGLAYITNPYDAETNFQNTALSGRVMFGMQGELAWTYRIHRKWQLRTGVTLTHFSNGAFKLPNSGVNIPALKVGISYQPRQLQMQTLPDSLPGQPTPGSVSLNISGAFFFKEIKLPGGKKYPGGTISMYVNKRLNQKSALNIGVDGFYNTALRQVIRQDPDIDSLHIPDFKRAGLTFGHELFIGRVSMLTQLGVYVYNPYQKIDTRVYQRFGLKYYFSRKLFAAMLLKTHFGTADCVEWALGVSL
ncbi:acyloxyacyl hydrolase [Rhodocytophaga rosea]|uniref:Acyloxyacyl hydrolase n=1 Tax=Rhodocytophaga rosea TaxID=2704465 RepID=A0A6C0GQM6_9BACT|nr:acyloxyacyl hydrolase [Rhodocytophaga rosea]QHT69913.1 acyloxyacyl hydrolase [Rhodocytophaga rosea]